jgi:lysyl-tRNA synthetase class I
MDKSTRNAIERATQQARKLLDEDFSSQLEGTFDVLRSGVIAPSGGVHLSARQQFQRGKIVAAIDHKRVAGTTTVEAITDYGPVRNQPRRFSGFWA